MGARTGYTPGTFCWVELATTDAAAAKGFYGELFGWEAEDRPAGEGMVYSMLRLGDDYVGALYEMSEEMRSRGVPPNWLSYVSVEDADAAARAFADAGGTVHAEPFDVLDVGRMAVLQDPDAAVVAVWQPRAHIGASRVNEPGCLTWNELSAEDPGIAAEFYGRAFGWQTEEVDTGGGPRYVVIQNAGRTNGGVMEGRGMPAHWRPYFAVESTGGAAEAAARLGAEALLPPLDVPNGRIAILRDPQGAVFGLFEGEFDD